MLGWLWIGFSPTKHMSKIKFSLCITQHVYFFSPIICIHEQSFQYKEGPVGPSRTASWEIDKKRAAQSQDFR